jgi:Fe-Mn family superoxide dismutase
MKGLYHMSFKRINLTPEFLKSFEGILSEKLMDLHYNFNHKVYEDGLNAALKDYPLDKELYNLETLMKNYQSRLPRELHWKIRFFGGGLLNHNLFFSHLKKDSQLPKGKLLEAINNKFGSLEALKNELFEKAIGLKVEGNLVGAGWV